jgi:beta-mannosidase
VLAARLWIDGKLAARDMDWPQPLKYLDFLDRGVEVRTMGANSSGEQILAISSKKPVKCLVFEEREGVKLSDSALDIAPGDEQTVIVSGLKPGDSPLSWRFLGQED